MTTATHRCTHCNQPADNFLLILTRQLWCCDNCRPLLLQPA